MAKTYVICRDGAAVNATLNFTEGSVSFRYYTNAQGCEMRDGVMNLNFTLTSPSDEAFLVWISYDVRYTVDGTPDGTSSYTKAFSFPAGATNYSLEVLYSRRADCPIGTDYEDEGNQFDLPELPVI